jgi:histidinol-phosphate aminotransferase
MQDATRFWSTGLSEMAPYVPGEQPQGGGWIKLNTNENPYPPSPNAIEAMHEALGSRMPMYPDPHCTDFRQTVAERFKIDIGQVFAGNGSDEILYFAFRAFFRRGSEVLFPDVSYSFYPVYAKATQVPFRLVPLGPDYEIRPGDYTGAKAGVIFPNPNAPTARPLDLGSVERILSQNPDCAVIVDEAYVDFGAESAVPLIAEYPNLLVVQTLSKSRSLAGLRVGWAMGSRGLIDALERVRDSVNSYTVDRVAQAGAAAALRDEAYFQETCAKVVATRDRFATGLEKLGFSVVPSRANFVFAAHPRLSSTELLASLRERRILVRAFRGPRLERHARISIGTDAEMDAVLEALRTI